MSDEISFSHYMSMCGWKGEEDSELLKAFQLTWAIHKETHGTVENLLCEPHSALKFVTDYGEMLQLTSEPDPGTVLRKLLNLRKGRKLK